MVSCWICWSDCLVVGFWYCVLEYFLFLILIFILCFVFLGWGVYGELGVCFDFVWIGVLGVNGGIWLKIKVCIDNVIVGV